MHLRGFNHTYLTPKAIERAESVIEEYDLHHHSHAQLPVDLRPLVEYISLKTMDLPPTTFGFSLDTGQEITIVLNNSLDQPMLRATLGHELGHIVCWHPNQLHALEEGRWVYDRLETEATTVAALLLLPQSAVRASLNSFEAAHGVAERYVVPLEVVLVRYAIYHSTGH